MNHKTVVVCDDDATLTTLMRHLLEKRGFTVLTAGDAADGLRLVRSSKPHLLLLDFHMEGGDGTGVLNGMKSVSEKRPYTIVVSSNEGHEMRGQMTALGADEVWEKPFNALDLLKRIEALARGGVI